MHNKFRTAVTSGVGREENRTKKGVTGNFHTNWAVLFLMLSGGYKLLVGSCSNFAHLKFFFDKSIGNNCANILFLTRQWFGSGTYCICWHSFSFTKKKNTISNSIYSQLLFQYGVLYLPKVYAAKGYKSHTKQYKNIF